MTAPVMVDEPAIDDSLFRDWWKAYWRDWDWRAAPPSKLVAYAFEEAARAQYDLMRRMRVADEVGWFDIIGGLAEFLRYWQTDVASRSIVLAGMREHRARVAQNERRAALLSVGRPPASTRNPRSKRKPRRGRR